MVLHAGAREACRRRAFRSASRLGLPDGALERTRPVRTSLFIRCCDSSHCQSRGGAKGRTPLPGERGLPGDAVRLSMAKNPSPNPQILFPLLIFFRALSPPPPPCGVFCNPRCIRACRVQRRFARFAFPRPNRRLCCVTSFLFRCSITWGAACGLPPGLARARPPRRT